jgi:hypothetical protein
LFRFKYCSANVLAKLFGDDTLTVTDVASDDGEQAVRDKIDKLSKEEVAD